MSSFKAESPTTGVTVTKVETLLPGLEILELLDPKQSLALLDDCDALVSLAEAIRARVVVQVEHRQAAEQEHLCSTATYLTRAHRHTGKQARQLVSEAMELDRLRGRERLPRRSAVGGSGSWNPCWLEGSTDRPGGRGVRPSPGVDDRIRCQP